MMMTPEQAEKTAELVHTIRPDWDVRGIYAALAKAAERADAGRLAIAALHAAMEPTNRTPAVIAMDGLHWQKAEGVAPAPKRTIEPPRTNDTSPDCPAHPGTKSWACKHCRTAVPRPVDFDAIRTAANQAARAERRAQLVDR